VAEEKQQEAGKYFLRLAEHICKWLDRVGYAYCKGEFMAQNPLWCQPLSQWKKYFDQWVVGIEPETQVRFGIFFDFRTAYGEKALTDELRQHLFNLLSDSRGFFLHLAEIAKRFDSHLNVFGNINLEKKGAHKNTLEIKSTVESVVFITRLFAFLYKIEAVNTVDRLNQLAKKKLLWPEEHSQIVEAYNALLRLRILNQLVPGNEFGGLDANFLEPASLDPADRRVLVESLRSVRRFKEKIGAVRNHVRRTRSAKQKYTYQYVNLEK
jgi:CBS domain-containing protein